MTERKKSDKAKRELACLVRRMKKEWEGLIWLNPPYSQARRWIARLAEHGNGIALIYARTETAMFRRHVWPVAKALLFLPSRVRFCRPDGTPADNGTAPSVLIAYGEEAARRLTERSIPGILITHWQVKEGLECWRETVP